MRDPITGNSYRNEVFALRPWRIGDSQFEGCSAQLCTTAEIYNFTLIKSLVLVIKGGALVERRELPSFMPEVPAHLAHLATELARNTPKVVMEIKEVPGADKFVMAVTKTALNRTRCKRSKHLCLPLTQKKLLEPKMVPNLNLALLRPKTPDYASSITNLEDNPIFLRFWVLLPYLTPTFSSAYWEDASPEIIRSSF